MADTYVRYNMTKEINKYDIFNFHLTPVKMKCNQLLLCVSKLASTSLAGRKNHAQLNQQLQLLKTNFISRKGC